MQYASYASAMSAPLSKIMLYRRFVIFCLWYTKYVMQWIASICLLCLCTTLTTMKKIICTNSEKLSENIQKAKKGKEKEFATLWNYETTGEKLKSVILVLNSPRSQQYSNIADSPSSSAISEFATQTLFFLFKIRFKQQRHKSNVEHRAGHMKRRSISFSFI